MQNQEGIKMQNIQIKPLGLDGVFEIQLAPPKDERGFFCRTYDSKIFREWGLDRDWVQESLSFSKIKGTVRGMHFQHPPHSETKLITLISGEVFFAVVDLRKDFPTFGKWVSQILSEERMNGLYVPKGCANGLCTLTDNCRLAYKMDTSYSKENEDIIKWDDQTMGIEWPIKVPTLISERDSIGQSLDDFRKKYGGL